MKQEKSPNVTSEKAVSTLAEAADQPEGLPKLDCVEAAPVDRQTALVAALMRAGTLTLSDWERAGLSAPFAAELVKQRRLATRTEDYIPHIQISRRLCDVLGIGQWCLVRLREWFDADTQTAYGSYALVVRGVWVGDTVAGWPYQPDNKSTDYADALESCRGVALRRIAAKSLRCGDQVWAQPCQQTHKRPNAQQGPQQAKGGQQTAPMAPDQLAGMIAAGTAVASQGTASLQAWWGSLLPEQRKALAGRKDAWKRAAAAADAVRDQAEAHGERL